VSVVCSDANDFEKVGYTINVFEIFHIINIIFLLN